MADEEFWIKLLESTSGGELWSAGEALASHEPAVRVPRVRDVLLDLDMDTVLHCLFMGARSPEVAEEAWRRMGRVTQRGIISAGPPKYVSGLSGPTALVDEILSSERERDRRDAIRFLPALERVPEGARSQVEVD